MALSGDGDDDDVAQPVPETTAAPPTTVAGAPATTLPATSTPSTARTPTTARPVTPGPLGTAAPGTAAPGTTVPGALPACAPSFFRATVTSDRPSYANGDTVQVTARFENMSGRACSYETTSASSQVLSPSGEPLTPVRTLTGQNPERVPFEPGTSQSFRSSWDTSICASGGACFPGRYTMVMDLTPFGGGRVSFDVA